MREAFIDWTPGTKKTQALAAAAELIVLEYTRQGYVLTLRQLYYQMVSRNLIPNDLRSYKRLAELVQKLRRSGRIDWAAIEDRGRVSVMLRAWTDPVAAVNTLINAYRLERWEDQDNYVEVWCEKDALSSVIEPICLRWHVRYLADKGYSSDTAVYDGAKRLAAAAAAGRTPVVIYLGDHDPSGLDMSRDIEARIALFARGMEVEVDRIALNFNQVEEYTPPPNPAKLSDSRAAAYVAEYGYESWEVDALDPQVLDALITSAIASRLDEDKYDAVLAQEETDKTALSAAARSLRQNQDNQHER